MGKNVDLAGRRFGKLTAIEPTQERKNGYTVWRCCCDCGREVLAASRFLKNGWVTDCGCAPQKKKYRDLTGQQFGKLTVIEESPKRDKTGGVCWRCCCACGNEVTISSRQLLAGYKKSCGCLGRPPLKDWIGRRFGNLEVISYAGKRQGSRYWHCRCHCGCNRELDVRQSALQNGHTKGCKSLDWNAVQDLAGKRFGDLTVLSYEGKKNGVHFWRCRCSCGKETVVSQFNLKSGHTKSCGCKVNVASLRHMVDGTCIESIRDRKPASNNTSGVRGVYRNRKNGRWAAQITFQGKTKYLGSYDRLSEAAMVRKEAEEIFDNFLKEYDEIMKEKKN